MKPSIEDAPRWLTRFYLIIVAPIVVVCTIVGRTWTETKSIPFFIRNDLADEWTEFRRVWRTAGSNRK